MIRKKEKRDYTKDNIHTQKKRIVEMQREFMSHEKGRIKEKTKTTKYEKTDA